MKKQSQFLVTFLCALTLLMSACSEPKKSKATAVVRGGARIDPAAPDATSFGTDRIWGAITKRDASITQIAFDDLVRKFGSASVSSSEIETTCGDASCTNGTGIRFIGDVKLAGGLKLNSLAVGQSVKVDSANSKIRIGIWDLAAVTGSAPGEVVIYLPGNVQGDVTKTGNVNLVFSDKYGSVTLSGMISGTTYTGDVSFVNQCSVNTDGECSGPGTSGQLGKFSVSTCGFFYCQ